MSRTVFCPESDAWDMSEFPGPSIPKLHRGPPGAPKTGEVQVARRQRHPRGVIGERAQAVEE